MAAERELSLERHRRLIDTALRAALRGAAAPPQLRRAMAYSVLSPGKRIRPLLCLAAAEACGAPAQRVLPFACAIELIHAYSLVHDDLPAMDDDVLRRGRATTHVAFGEATAILAGDALLTEAFRLAASGTVPAKVALAIVAELAAAAGAGGMVGGQAADMAAEAKAVGRKRLEAIHRRKTGALLRVAVRIGALGAQAPAARLARLTDYAEALGLAFQIADDLSDEHGTTAMTGKTEGRDRQRRKSTFVTACGAATARRRTIGLIDEALAAIAPLGTQAEPLRAIARRIVARVLALSAAPTTSPCP